MARPKSDDKRNALMAAAIRVIAAQGLSAPTAAIAQAAGISTGSLFTYFATKADLLNQLYLELKARMAQTALAGVSPKLALRTQFARMWANWTRWATTNPDQRRALALLQVADDITPVTRAASHDAMAPLAALLQQARATGPLKHAPMSFVVALMTSLAETTMDFMLHDPANAETCSKTGFEALWRALT
ncbi:MAG TPA: TetR/AcrR family transcriptional regulator [Kofleriaceae bacterium]|jgi:AcrR family transcriptional regulator